MRSLPTKSAGRTRYNFCAILTTYPEIGEREKAVTLANKMPPSGLSRQNLLHSIYSGNERFEQGRSNLIDSINQLYFYIICHTPPFDGGRVPYTNEYHILIREKIIAILDIIFEDGNYGFFGETVAWMYIEMAIYYAQLNDYDNATEKLKLAAKHSIKYDLEYHPDSEYTCLLLRGKKFGGVLYNSAENDSMHQLGKMKDSAFDPIRKNKAFIKIEEELKKYAKQR